MASGISDEIEISPLFNGKVVGSVIYDIFGILIFLVILFCALVVSSVLLMIVIGIVVGFCNPRLAKRWLEEYHARAK